MRMYVNVELYEDFARFYCLFGYGNNAWSIRVERWLDSITEYQAVTMSTIPSEPVVVGLTNGTHEWRWQSWMPDSDGKKYTTTKIWLMKNDCAIVTWYIWILLLRPQMSANAWQIWWIWYIPTRLFHLVDSDLFGCANNETYLMSTEYTYNEEHEQCWATVYREKKAISTCMAVGFCKLYSNPAISSALVREYIIFFLSILSSLHSLSLLLCVPTEYHPGELAARCGVSANRADILMTVLKFKIKFNIRQLTNQVKCVSSEQ